MGKRIVATLLLLLLIFAVVSTALAVEKVNVSGTRYVDTKGKGPVNIRKGPSTKKEFTALREVPDGAMVTLHKMTVTGKWYYVDYKSNYGWIQASYLSTTKRKTLVDKAKEEAEKKAKKMKEAINKITSPYFCDYDGCNAVIVERLYGKPYTTNKKNADGSWSPITLRPVHKVCANGHAYNVDEPQ